MAGHHTSTPRQKKMYSSLIIMMLILFFLVYNRESIAKEIYPEKVAQIYNPNLIRKNNPWNQEEIKTTEHFVRNGHLVVKTGNGQRDNLFMQLNRQDKTFSTAGIIFIENNYPFVYTVIPPTDSIKGGIKRDSLCNFINPENTLGFGIYQVPINTKQIKHLQEFCVNAYKVNLQFDPDYNLKSDDKMYNAEFVYKAFQKATNNPKFFSITKVNEFEFVTIDALFLRPKNNLIIKTKYR